MSDNDYLIKPFTIDGKGSCTLDDGFSISPDDHENPILNIHVSLVSYEYLKKNYKLDKLLSQTFSKKIERCLGPQLLDDYSLQPGPRKVLTLRISEGNTFDCFCEEIDIANNYTYDNFNKKDFYKCLRNILKTSFHNNQEMVSALMDIYSSILSKYLFNQRIDYLMRERWHKIDNPKFRKGNFTSPLRKRESLINQFILLNHMNNVCGDLSSDNPLSIEEETKIITYIK